MTADERSRRITQAWDLAWDKGDISGLEALLSPGYRRHTASSSEGETKEQFLASIITTRAAFPDLITIIDEIVVAGDSGGSVAIRWHSEGTHTHGFLGVPPTHRKVTVHGATFAHFDGDQIADEFVTWDPRALLAALGIISVGQD